MICCDSVGSILFLVKIHWVLKSIKIHLAYYEIVQEKKSPDLERDDGKLYRGKCKQLLSLSKGIKSSLYYFCNFYACLKLYQYKNFRK